MIYMLRPTDLFSEIYDLNQASNNIIHSQFIPIKFTCTKMYCTYTVTIILLYTIANNFTHIHYMYSIRNDFHNAHTVKIN